MVANLNSRRFDIVIYLEYIICLSRRKFVIKNFCQYMSDIYRAVSHDNLLRCRFSHQPTDVPWQVVSMVLGNITQRFHIVFEAIAGESAESYIAIDSIQLTDCFPGKKNFSV